MQVLTLIVHLQPLNRQWDMISQQIMLTARRPTNPGASLILILLVGIVRNYI